MKQFKATLNGVTYTDRKEFFNAIRKIGNGQIKEISIHESEDNVKSVEKEKPVRPIIGLNDIPGTVPENRVKSEKPSNENDNSKLVEYMNDYCDMLGLTPEVKSRISEPVDLLGVNFKKPEDKYNPVSVRRAQLQNEVKERAVFNHMVEEFIVSEPLLIQFSADEATNDHRLDEMSSMLKTQLDKFNNEFVRCSDVVAAQFRKKLENSLQEINQEIEKTDYDARLHELDARMADLEQYLKLCKEYKLKNDPVAEKMYESSKYEWKKLHTDWIAIPFISKRDFYKMIASYYNYLLEKITLIHK